MDRETLVADARGVASTTELAGLLRRLRRRQARHCQVPVVSYRELAARTGWSHSIIGAYLTGKVLPPVDRLDELARQLDATPMELGALATARDRVGEQRPAPPVPPRQLPAGAATFIGRLAALTALEEPGGPVVLAGPAGMGKTALAVHWAHGAAARFPDGQLFADLSGPPPLRDFLVALGIPAFQVPEGVDAQVGLYRSLLAGRRVLVLLDGARDADQIRPLLPGTPGCQALITSRSQLTSLVAVEGARLITLDPLDGAQARRLLTSRLGVRRMAADPLAVATVVAACAGVPLALAIVAARVAARPDLPLGEVARELISGRLPAPETWDRSTDIQAVVPIPVGAA